ncbi:MAG: ABC transporter ATP-binding protein [Pseudomonadota bacterium]
MKRLFFRVLRKLLGDDESWATINRLILESAWPLRRQYGVAVIAMIFVAATTALTALLMEYIVDALTVYDQRDVILLVAGSVALTFVVKGIALYIQEVTLSKAGNRIVAIQQKKVFASLLNLGLAYLVQRESSDFLQKIVSGAKAVRRIIETIITTFVRDLAMLIGLVAVMFWQHPLLAILVLAVGPFIVLFVRYLVARVRDITRRETTSLVEIIKVLQEASRGVKVIKVFSLENKMQSRMDDAVETVEANANATARLGALTGPMMETISGFAIAGIIVLTAFSATASTSAGELMSFITAALLAYEPAKRLARMRVRLEAPLARAKIMNELFDDADDPLDGSDTLPVSDLRSDIVFDDVSFGYEDRDTSVLNGLSLRFSAGRTTALVGPSGAGKSTILNLILKFYAPQHGKIMIGDADFQSLSHRSVLDRIAYVGQDTFLFSDTIRENIRMGRVDATDAEVEAVARDAHAHDFITELPDGYDTQVGENGVFLSGGQRQRLAIARAMLRQADILLLDEATSALDAKAERHVQSALSRLTANTTTIVIAHRLSTVEDADCVCVISNGTLVDSGTFTELLDRNGLFRELFGTQHEGHWQTVAL